MRYPAAAVALLSVLLLLLARWIQEPWDIAAVVAASLCAVIASLLAATAYATRVR